MVTFIFVDYCTSYKYNDDTNVVNRSYNKAVQKVSMVSTLYTWLNILAALKRHSEKPEWHSG